MGLADFLKSLLAGGASANQFQDFFKHAVLPAIALVSTGGAKTFVNWIQNRSRGKRSDELTKRIVQLEGMIAKLPKRDSSDMPITPHMVLTDELKLNIAELKYLQTRMHYSFHQFCHDVSFRTRRALILYRPTGFLGYLLQYTFYAYVVSALLLMVAISSSSTSTETSSTDLAQQAGGLVSKVLTFIVMFCVLSIPAWILRFFALRRIDAPSKAVPLSDGPTSTSASGVLPSAIAQHQI